MHTGWVAELPNFCSYQSCDAGAFWLPEWRSYLTSVVTVVKEVGYSYAIVRPRFSVFSCGLAQDRPLIRPEGSTAQLWNSMSERFFPLATVPPRRTWLYALSGPSRLASIASCWSSGNAATGTRVSGCCARK